MSDEEPVVQKRDNIIERNIDDEMKKSFLEYAMSVIVNRALPDVRDGLKPVHRRVLYAMNGMGLKHNTAYKKSARIVGDTMGKYHPHGDAAIYDTVVRMAQDFSLRYPFVDGQGNWGCFTKDTEVLLTDGRTLSFENLVKEYEEGKINYTYTCAAHGDIMVAEIKHPRLTKKQADLVRVTLDNGTSIRCTPNHRFMLKNGEYVEAQHLKPGTSLMPMYTRLSSQEDGYAKDLTGYTLVKNPQRSSWIFAHHLADKHNIDMGIYSRSQGRVRHHIDFNKLNNNPTNIIRMKWKEHWLLHSQLTKKKHAEDSEYVHKLAQGRQAYWSKKENIERHRMLMNKRNTKNWQDMTYREHMRKKLSEANKKFIQEHPEKRDEMSKRATKTLTKLWQNPEYRKQMRKHIIKGNKNHTTNSTGKKKFLKVCNHTLERTGTLNHALYEAMRNEVYPYGHAPTWETGYNKYYDGQGVETILNDATQNHKVLSVTSLQNREDVYDLTIDTTHNFALAAGVFVHNSIDGDNAAAMRYTEARMRKIAEEMLLDIEKETVNFIDNYDGQNQEPTVLPSKVPNLLINGSTGIAVGMATNMPPHNLAEVGRAIIELINNPEADYKELMRHIKAPDFPTGGIITGTSGIHMAYQTGRGRVRVKSVIVHEEGPKKNHLIIKEIPYMVNKSTLIEQIAQCVRDKKIEGISDIRDESDRTGMRIVLDLKRDANPEIIQNQLFKYTRCKDSFGIINLALVNGEPKVLSLKELLEEFIKHRQEVVRRRAEYDLKKAKERAHILEGLVIALRNIDRIVELIKKAEDVTSAQEQLVTEFALTEIQAKAILEMRLSRLAALEQEKIRKELEELTIKIAELENILADEHKILSIIKEETQYIIDNYGDARRTKIEEGGDDDDDIDMEDLIDEEDVVVTISTAGYIKRIAIDTYKAQRRGGKGIIGAEKREGDALERLFIANTHNFLLVFTNTGQVHWVKVYRVPEAGRYSKGTAIINLIDMAKDEKVSAVVPVKEFKEGQYLLMATKHGIIKKTDLSAYGRPRRGGIIAISLDEGDDVVDVKLTDGTKQIMLATANGMAVKFNETDARPVGRTSRGVRGVRLGVNDRVVGMVLADDKGVLATITENGFGKRTRIDDYRLITRGGKGVRNIICSPRNGKVVAVRTVTDEDDIMFISANGIVIRTPAKDISVIGRNTQGVRLMKLGADDKVVSASRIVSEENGDVVQSDEE